MYSESQRRFINFREFLQEEFSTKEISENKALYSAMLNEYGEDKKPLATPKIIKLEWQNMYSYSSNGNLIFDESMSLVGKNASGKSSIIHILIYALFGFKQLKKDREHFPLSADYVLNNSNKKNGFVKCKFTAITGDSYIILREIFRNSPDKITLQKYDTKNNFYEKQKFSVNLMESLVGPKTNFLAVNCISQNSKKIISPDSGINDIETFINNCFLIDEKFNSYFKKLKSLLEVKTNLLETDKSSDEEEEDYEYMKKLKIEEKYIKSKNKDLIDEKLIQYTDFVNTVPDSISLAIRYIERISAFVSITHEKVFDINFDINRFQLVIKNIISILNSNLEINKNGIIDSIVELMNEKPDFDINNPKSAKGFINTDTLSKLTPATRESIYKFFRSVNTYSDLAFLKICHGYLTDFLFLRDCNNYNFEKDNKKPKEIENELEQNTNQILSEIEFIKLKIDVCNKYKKQLSRDKCIEIWNKLCNDLECKLVLKIVNDRLMFSMDDKFVDSDLASGYQRFLIDLTFRIFLIIYNTHVPFFGNLFIDEGVSCADDDNKKVIQRILECISNLDISITQLSHTEADLSKVMYIKAIDGTIS